MTTDRAATDARRTDIKQRHVLTHRPSSSARGLHHVALICSDAERTITFYQELLEFPLTEVIEDRDHRGSSRLFFDVGNGNLLAFVDLPEIDLEPYREVLGGLHHVVISVDPATWERLRGKLEAAGVPHQVESGASLHFKDPDGARLELLADHLGELHGTRVL